MRIPQDPDNVTPRHIDGLIADAFKKFDRYERRVDFTWPQEKIDELYRPYQLACMRCRDYRGLAVESQRKLIDNLP